MEELAQLLNSSLTIEEDDIEVLAWHQPPIPPPRMAQMNSSSSSPTNQMMMVGVNYTLTRRNEVNQFFSKLW